MTFSELIKRVAELAGCAYYTNSGQGEAEVPIDRHDLDKCKRVVNDAVRMFISDSPVKGWKWMRRLMLVTFDPTGGGVDNIDNDPARYMLPSHFGGTVDGPVRYAANTTTGAWIEWADEAFIRSRRTPVVNTGYPLFAAILPYEPSSSVLTSSRRWEIIVDPQPVAAHAITFPYTLHFDDMRIEAGEADSGSFTTLVDSSRTEADDFFNGWVMRIVDGTGKGQVATITDFSDGTFTFAAVTTAIDSTSVYVIEPAGNLHPAGRQFDDAVLWACKAAAETQFESVMGNHMQYYRQVALPNAHAIDARSGPRKLGRHGVVQERIWTTVTYNPRT
jgi:hypothetical protein